MEGFAQEHIMECCGPMESTGTLRHPALTSALLQSCSVVVQLFNLSLPAHGCSSPGANFQCMPSTTEVSGGNLMVEIKNVTKRMQGWGPVRMLSEVRRETFFQFLVHWD